MAGGLLAVSGDKLYFKISDQKLRIAEMLCGKPYRSELESTIRLIQNQVNQPVETSNQVFTREYIAYLNRYSKGAIQFGQPKPVAVIIDDALFEQLYQQFINERPLIEA